MTANGDHDLSPSALNEYAGAITEEVAKLCSQAGLADLSDALVFLVAIPNLLGLYLLAPRLRREVDGYGARLRRD